MILAMSRVRILGPRPKLAEVLGALQDLGLIHLAPPPETSVLTPVLTSPREERLRLRLGRLLEDAAVAGRLLEVPPATPAAKTPLPLPRTVRLIVRARREGERLVARIESLEEEQALLARYEAVFLAFEPLLRSQPRWASGRAYHVVLRPGQKEMVARLRSELGALLGDAFEIRDHPLPAD